MKYTSPTIEDINLELADIICVSTLASGDGSGGDYMDIFNTNN